MMQFLKDFSLKTLKDMQSFLLTMKHLNLNDVSVWHSETAQSPKIFEIPALSLTVGRILVSLRLAFFICKKEEIIPTPQEAVRII